MRCEVCKKKLDDDEYVYHCYGTRTCGNCVKGIYSEHSKMKQIQQRIDKVIKIIQNDTTLNEQRQRDRMINILRGEEDNG